MKRLIPVGLNAVKRGGRRLFSGQPPSNASCPSKAKQPVACAHPTPKAEAPAADKKCPVFCSHSEKQCPPLVPPVTVGPKTPPALIPAPGSTLTNSPQQPIPTSAIVAYRMAWFGAKVGVGVYCIKWTVDNYIWGSSDDTRAFWDRCKDGLQTAVPALNTVRVGDPCDNFSVSHTWNNGVIYTFDKLQEAAHALRSFAVSKERAAYGLLEAADASETVVAESSETVVADSSSEAGGVGMTFTDWQEFLRRLVQWDESLPEATGCTTEAATLVILGQPPDEDALVETIAQGDCHIVTVNTEPAGTDLHRDCGRPPPEAVRRQPPREGSTRTLVVCKQPCESSSAHCGVQQVKMEPCGKPDCHECPTLAVRAE